jgi:hypothetical protein
MFSLPLLLWLAAAVLAVASLMRLCDARRKQLEERLRRWLSGELETIAKKRKLFLKIRKQRAEQQEAEEAAARRAAAAVVEIADLNIGEMFADRQRREAETAAAAKKMRSGLS